MKGRSKIRNPNDRNPNDRNPKQNVSDIRISNFGFLLKRLLLLLFPVFFLTACSGMKNSWTNFRAHYNTYYNAKKSFNAGVQLIEEQPVEINPEAPVMVHPVPPEVGSEEFDKVIEKGAHLLRKFPESKWTDEALFLMGKSYYYKRNYFLAIEKFEELSELSGNNLRQQQAALWKARSLLSSEQYSEGEVYISGITEENFWTAATRAELKVLLAEHHAMQQNWAEAANNLSASIADFKEGSRKGRVFFLYGQVLERLERYGEAFFAYDNVDSRFPAYSYVFWSRMKQAEVARKDGNLDRALDIYLAMRRDDKNIDRLDRINYEIARTQEMKGDYTLAEEGYKEILRSERRTASPNVEAKTYFRLGKIFSEVYEDLSVAAAYFDSSASRVTNEAYLESSFNAGELASAYGSYRGLRNTIQRLDSLLWLGELQPAQLDSVLDELRRKRRQELSQQAQEGEGQPDQLINIGAGQPENGDEPESFEYGYLNYKNNRLRTESMTRFTAIWGNRPLVDNWRRIEAVRSTSLADMEISEPRQQERAAGLAGGEDARLAIDISEIPSTTEQKEDYRRQLVNAKYQLGNLFFIRLNTPDSAKTYFLDIVQNHPESALVPQSMYSLFELHTETGDLQRARYWARSLQREFPESRFAENAALRMNETTGRATPADSAARLSNRLQSIDTSDTLSVAKAEQFRQLAIANRSLEMAPYVHYRAIQNYVELAKSETDPLLYQNFMAARESGEKDMVPDSTEWMSYPFYGPKWDSVRTLIGEYDSLFTKRPHSRQLQPLAQVLDTSDLPSDPPKEMMGLTGTSRRELRACEDMNGIEVVGGIPNFLARIDLPERDHEADEDLPDSVRYELFITEEGEVRYFRRISPETFGQAEEALENAIRSFLLFDPPMVDGTPGNVRCSMTFSLKPRAQEARDRVRETVPDDIDVPERPEKMSPETKMAEDEKAVELKDCEQMDGIDIVGGMSNFLARINLPEQAADPSAAWPETVTYELFITEQGKVDDFRRLSSESLGEAEEVLEMAIRRFLLFDPPMINGAPGRVRCSITFPLGVMTQGTPQ